MSDLSLRIVSTKTSDLTSANQRTVAIVATALTFGRLPLGAFIAVAVSVGASAAAIVAIAVFVLWDVCDGVLARHFGAETQFRRSLDGVVDKLCVHGVAAIAVYQSPPLLAVWVLMLCRDVVQGVIGARAWRRTGVVAAGAKWHRIFTLAVATWGIMLILHFAALTAVASVVMLVCGALTLADYSIQLNQSVQRWRGIVD